MDELTVLSDQSEIVHYDDPLFPVYLRRNKLSDYSFMRVFCHWHQEFEFFLTEKGHTSYFVNGNIVNVKEGEMIFVNSRCPHYGFSQDGTDCTYLCLVFQPSLLMADASLGENFITPLKEDSAKIPFLVFSADRCTEIRKEMLSILDLLQKKEPFYSLLVLSHLYAFWSDFLSLKGKEEPAELNHSEKGLLVKKMLAFIYCHYPEKITVADIAASAAVSTSYAIHLFTELLHYPPMTYLNVYRVEKGGELLRESDLDITEISRAVGFFSPSYFAEAFHKEKGFSPRVYREMVLKKK
jgi:AraC-like DNA-binding protein